MPCDSVSTRNPAQHKNLLFFTVLLATIVLLHSEHALQSDEGMVLWGAWELMNGRIPYIDFFSYVPPGSYYTLYWLWQLFGADYWIAKSFAMLVLFLCAVGVYKLARYVLGKDTAYFPPVFLVILSVPWPIVTYHIFSLAFIVWAIYWFIKALDENSMTGFALSGLSMGLCSLFLLHTGLFIGLFLSGWLLLYNKAIKGRACSSQTLAFIISAGLPLSALLYWPLDIVVDRLIIFPLERYAQFTPTMPSYNPILIALPSTLLLLIAYVHRTKRDYKIWFLLFLQTAFLLLSLQLADYYHLTILTFPLYILWMSLSTQETLFSYKRVRPGHYFVALIALGIPMTVKFYQWSAPVLWLEDHPFIDKLRATCAHSEYMYAGPFLPGLYFEMKTLNATRYDSLIPRLHTQEQFLDAVSDLEKHKPGCAVMQYEMVKHFNYDKNNPVDNYIQQHYTLRETYGSVEIYTSVSTSAPAQ